jgi:hypothetical protein
LGALGHYPPIASVKATTNMGGNAVNRPRAADDFATIRARMEELRREREGTKPSGKEAQRDAPVPSGGAIRSPDYLRYVIGLMQRHQRPALGQGEYASPARAAARLRGRLLVSA